MLGFGSSGNKPGIRPTGPMAPQKELQKEVKRTTHSVTTTPFAAASAEAAEGLCVQRVLL